MTVTAEGSLYVGGSNVSMNSQPGSPDLGKYELRERLGRGGMAEVWKAFDTQLHRYVAIKLLHADLQTDPEFITRFSREARVIASLHHPNIVQIYDFETTHSPHENIPVAYMVMEYIEGQTLAHYIRNTSNAGRFPPPIAIVHLFTSISKAIDYAHQQGMIHRDIKPANILLDKRNTLLNPMGEPVLTDFGIAKLMGAVSATISGMWLGTPLYISPEQAQGQPGNERSDIYSLGVILYEICTGVQPFRGESIPAIITQHLRSMPISPALINPGIPPALTMVILRVLSKDPADRFSSASAMTAAMAEAFNLPVPADLILPDLSYNITSGPTYLTPSQPDLPQYRMPPGVQPSPVVPVMGSTSQALPAAAAHPQLTPSPISDPGFPATPINSTPARSTPLPAVQKLQTEPPLHWPPGTLPPAYSLPPTSARSKRNWKMAFIAVIVILFLLAASTLAALFLFNHPGSTTAGTNSVEGNVTFLSSGQVNSKNSSGVDDEVQVNLRNVPNPAPGKSYYAWLGNAPLVNEDIWVRLGPLQVNQGNAQLPSPYHDLQRSDLLLYASSFLVTEEASNLAPTQPTSDHSSWLFSSQPSLLTLTHLRHLLADSPELDARQLSGGLGIWFLQNTEKVLEWAGAARGDLLSTTPDTEQVHRQIVRILDYIDGADSVSMDVAPGTPLYATPTQYAQIALVGPPIVPGPPGTTYKGVVAPGYVYLIPVHLNAAVATPQASAQQRQLAHEIDSALDQVTADLELARQDAKALVALNKTQLLTPQALSAMNDLVAEAQSAYTGSTNPGQPQEGAIWIYQNLEGMAIFEVQQYKGK